VTDEARVLPKMIPLRTVAAELGRTVRGDNGEPVVSDAIEVPIGPKIGPSFPAITEADLLCGYGAAEDVCVGCLP